MTAEESGMLIIETPSPGVKLLRLNRPEKRNALATPLLAAIADGTTCFFFAVFNRR